MTWILGALVIVFALLWVREFKRRVKSGIEVRRLSLNSEALIEQLKSSHRGPPSRASVNKSEFDEWFRAFVLAGITPVDAETKALQAQHVQQEAHRRIEVKFGEREADPADRQIIAQGLMERERWRVDTRQDLADAALPEIVPPWAADVSRGLEASGLNKHENQPGRMK